MLRLPGLTDYASYLDRYDGEIACLFSSLGSFLRTLRDAGTLDRAMFALTADHGESLGERDRYFRHGDNVFQENARAAAAALLPESAPAERGRRVADVVSLVDLLPTALEFAGIGGPSGRTAAPPRPAAAGRLRSGRSSPWSRPGGLYGFACFAGRSKSMLRSDVSPAVWESFDLGSDPAEGTAGEVSPELREAMARNYAAWNDHQTPFVVENNLMSQTLRADFVAERLRKRDQEDLERLRSLGYVN
ncbi:MAG: sulfatase-like hydrolase/transferase [Thermoanaerobaculia bacterium]